MISKLSLIIMSDTSAYPVINGKPGPLVTTTGPFGMEFNWNPLKVYPYFSPYIIVATRRQCDRHFYCTSSLERINDTKSEQFISAVLLEPEDYE